jgi:hypothetical protein
MQKLFKILISILLIVLTIDARAQIKVNYDEPGDSSTTQLQEADDSTVVVIADPRLEQALRRHKDLNTGSIYRVHGYRLQIYSGNDRAMANKLKVEFMRSFPGIRTYMSYVEPQFRLKVGDYRTREEAQKMYHDVGDLCHPCMIVPDIVVINTFKND